MVITNYWHERIIGAVASFSDRPARLAALTTYRLSQTAKLAKRDLDASLAERGMRLRHLAVLALLDEAPATQLEVGRRLDLDPSDVTATVDDLQTRGWVTRTPDRTDRRRKVVTLTSRGQRALAQLDEMAHRLADTLLEAVPPRRRAQLHSDLGRILLARDAQVGATNRRIDRGPTGRADE